MFKCSINEHRIELHRGDALAVLPDLSGPFGAVIMDPPYSSGAATLAGKQARTAIKYTNTKRACPLPDFEGDTMDQRSWIRWMTDLLRATRIHCIEGAVLCAFSDWRQLPSLADAIQHGGWCWRGVAVWDKINSRPQRGRFRQQAEFIAWGSNGPMSAARGVAVLPGVFSYTQQRRNERHHQTEKPLELMRQIVRICTPGGAILDPCVGGGSTLLAAALEGYDSVGIEISDTYYQVAAHRLHEAAEGRA